MSAGYEVRVTPHVSGNTYNVDLVSWDRRGNGMVAGKAFNVSREEANKEAQRIADLYNATIEDES
jgi:hypothetical protein